jgi:hypothetical protein
MSSTGSKIVPNPNPEKKVSSDAISAVSDIKIKSILNRNNKGNNCGRKLCLTGQIKK